VLHVVVVVVVVVVIIILGIMYYSIQPMF